VVNKYTGLLYSCTRERGPEKGGLEAWPALLAGAHSVFLLVAGS
jgi:hypothetical protein